MAMDPYKVLGVDEKASDDDIKKAYKKFAKQFHPDKNPGNKKAEEKFKEISAAYDKIQNAEARQKYSQEKYAEQYAYAGANQNMGGGGHFSENIDPRSFEDLFSNIGLGGIFEQFEGQKRGSQKRARKQELMFKLEIDFWQSMLGGMKTVQIPNGEKIEIRIPKGIEDGQLLRMSGKKANSQDILFEIHIKNDDRIKLTDGTLTVVYDLPVIKAIMGGEQLIDLPLGKFMLNIPAGTSSGKKFKLKGKGPEGMDLVIETRLALLPHEQDKLRQSLTRA